MTVNNKRDTTQKLEPIFGIKADTSFVKIDKNGKLKFDLKTNGFDWHSSKLSNISTREDNQNLFYTTWQSQFGNTRPKATVRFETSEGPLLLDLKIKKPRFKRNGNDLVIKIRNKSNRRQLKQLRGKEINNFDLSIEPKSSTSNRITARYHYGNGDYYDLEGTINDYRYPKELNKYYEENQDAIGSSVSKCRYLLDRLASLECTV